MARSDPLDAAPGAAGMNAIATVLLAWLLLGGVATALFPEGE